MRVKDGVIIDGVHPYILIAAAVYDLLRQSRGWGEGTITSVRDGGDAVGAARVTGSLHPHGLAVDLRTRDLDANAARSLAVQLRMMLGGAFDVVEEADHLHVELLTGLRRA